MPPRRRKILEETPAPSEETPGPVEEDVAEAAWKHNGKTVPVHAWKPHRPKDKDEEQSQSKPSAKAVSRPPKKKKAELLIEELKKRELVNTMDKEHPVVSLTEIVQIAGDVKRKAQAVIGRFVQLVSAGPRSSMDNEVLHAICPPMTEELDENEDDENDGEVKNRSPKYAASKVNQETVLTTFTSPFLLKRGPTKLARLVNHLLTRCPPPPPKSGKTYQGGALLESTGLQLAQELRQHYKRGCLELSQKLAKKVEKGTLDKADTAIDHEPTITNFLKLNRHENLRRIAPLSSTAHGFLSRRGKSKTNQTSFQRNTATWTLDRIREHLSEIRVPEFNAKTYGQKGYVLRGAITTNGFRLNLEAFKLKELHAARYKRLPPEKLPSRLTSTVAGTSDYLTEIRHVIRSRDDVQAIWNCDPTVSKLSE
ncbi:hypothetical protein BGZ65_001943 [Modicella reniformis]|uniref:Uncharacterized protein n=1 Tax=Modicella reniformis TaxID=1440133 RepID=A0A9P6M9W0_9FUNG|nr:hypothetical protein BGZ65_001943 [Modicella reniformis]